MPAYRKNTRKCVQGARHAFQPATPIHPTLYAQAHADACAGLAYSVSKLSLHEASAAVGHGAGPDNHLGDSMSPTALAWLRVPPSSTLPRFSTAPYPGRKQQNSLRTARKYTATEHPPTSPTTPETCHGVLRGPGQGIDPYAALRAYEDFVRGCVAALESRPNPTASNPPQELYNSSWPHGFNPFVAHDVNQFVSLRDYDRPIALTPAPAPSSTASLAHFLLDESPAPTVRKDRHYMSDHLSTTIRELGHRLASTRLESPKCQSNGTQATTGYVDVGSEDEVRDEWVPSLASSSEDTGSEYSSEMEEL